MNHSKLSVACLASLLLSPMALAGTFEFQGQAIADNGDTLYTEHHQMQGECNAGSFAPTQHRVEYRSPTGEAFGEKQLAFERSPLMPVVSFTQPKFSEQMDIRYGPSDQVNIDWQTPEGKRERYSTGIPEQLVVDSGFDHFDPILLGYNEQGALTHYQGLTNIRQNADTNYTATIRYQVNRYPDCPLLP